MSALSLSSASLPASSRAQDPRRGSIRETLLVVAVVLAVVGFLRTFVIEPYVISGVSMEPTFADAERLLISKLATKVTGLGRGDIIIFEHPEEPGKRLIKRIVGLPGETVVIQDGRVFVNGAPLDEPYLDPALPDLSQMRPVHVDAEHYFVLGDNRDRSNDSRRMGTIARSAVIGKALFTFYPKLRLL
jgi:signal peptidase I